MQPPDGLRLLADVEDKRDALKFHTTGMAPGNEVQKDLRKRATQWELMEALIRAAYDEDCGLSIWAHEPFKELIQALGVIDDAD